MENAIQTTVLGGGSFGTAMAQVLAENGHPVRLWMRSAEQAEAIRHTRINHQYFPELELDSLVEPTTDMGGAIEQAELVFVALPSKVFRDVIRNAAGHFRDQQMVVSLTKGIERDGFRLMSQVLKEELPGTRVGVLSGPNLAGELVQHEITASVIASEDRELRERVQQALGNAYFRIYANLDVYGVELGGALKNIYAVVSGLADARGMGENTKSMLITRSLAEMSRFAVSMGANPMTFLGLAGVGDLIVTCSSSLSRNYRVGYAVGQGSTLDEAVTELGQVAEGVRTLELVHEKAIELDVYMPLVRGLYQILYRGASITDVVGALMNATQNSDVEFILPRQGEGSAI
ncbi:MULTISPECIES: NAD(P)H-dependent glycerol-3-phosphate dehydrogenase [Gammaproteobacteria]|jgi:glycerol-3-phosphate dehydrogenase (NAD(P)+)|uniref:Glycerol-3-phosphate dehydrogenase [NAD(P)+] n=1 Tax=Vreelandella halophila TaxID=86177 RepID=A0A9X4YBQ4_9GAMM|nr:MULTISPECIES: NAD(P)H-dependent glycerol-3-phosphate dehydrogenase [Gammaproteobacteria]KAA8984482.1 NAD(P)H-dependent glycerol-3-phosphate dehydrogenase [Halospina sp. K52047b]MYL26762.1 NAD(P)H-dependent glycerol-3-phosphate dehydrogenase [Halomonas utahensis]MYL74023.1 NAD(P)H-dependent glycerol-3-phosphate dehydrogenase [Halomonas sp. 22501_18_FS]